MESITIFGFTFNINPVAFTLPIGDGWEVRWYGIIIAVGLLLAMLYGFKRAKSVGIDPDRLMDCVLVTVPSCILGARLYYCLFKGTMSDFLNIHSGGLAIYGAVIATVIVGPLMCKLRKVNVFAGLDLAALGFLIGQSIGRWGNFVNQEAYGTFTGSSWFGMTGSLISEDLIDGKIIGDSLVHPCFLYESLWCALGFVLLHFYSKKKKYNGQIALMYAAWYGFGRFFIEGFRTDSLYLGNVIRVSQLLSALVVIGSIITMIVIKNKGKEKEKEAEYVALFEDTDAILMDEEEEE